MSQGIEDSAEWRKNNVETQRPKGNCVRCSEPLVDYHCNNMGCRYCSVCREDTTPK